MSKTPFEITELIRTATEFVEELRRFGYGETNLKPLPGSYDPFVAALEAAREKAVDQALDQYGTMTKLPETNWKPVYSPAQQAERKKIPLVHYYNGKRVEEMTREELIEAVIELGNEYR